MKRQVLVVVLLCLATLCGCVLFSPPEVSGRWEGTARLKMMPEGPKPYEIVLVLTETGGVIAGTLRVVERCEVISVTGSLVGRHVEMMCSLLDTIIFEGEVHRRTMTGTCTRHEATDTWEVSRVE